MTSVDNTKESNDLMGKSLEGGVLGSPIDTALLGHFREYYGLGVSSKVEQLQNDYNNKFVLDCNV